MEDEKLDRIIEFTGGNAFMIKHLLLGITAGKPLSEELESNVSLMLSEYIENTEIVQWQSEIADFLMRVSVTDTFTLPLAEFITGNGRAAALIKRAEEVGYFLTEKNGEYRIESRMLGIIRARAERILGKKTVLDNAYNAGLYYEMNDMVVPALDMYAYCGNESRIRELLIRNAKVNPGGGYYYEMRKYYFMLDTAEIEKNPVLLSGMSILYAMHMQMEKSEYYYDKLRGYYEKSSGAEKKEALGRLVFLDVTLPHRGSSNLLEVIKKIPAILINKGIDVPDVSVTSNLPSTMNGGKDFCRWSKKDRELAQTLGNMLEMVLGSYGKGLANAGLGESLYEKGADDCEVLSLLSKARVEAETGGKIEIEFAAVGVQARLNISAGNTDAVKSAVESFEKKVTEDKANQLKPNLAALKCRLALYTEDKRTIIEWLARGAPDEDMEFYAMARYRYLTKVRCYILMGEYTKAYVLLEKLRYYAEYCDRLYILMELGILTAIVKRNMGSEWKDDFIKTLENICEYKFIRIVSEEGAAVSELLDEVKPLLQSNEKLDKKWLERLVEETKKTARRYPKYLHHQSAQFSDFSENALQILRMQADGLSITKIADTLGMSADNVKYHVTQNYRKLGASGKAEAVLIARELKLL